MNFVTTMGTELVPGFGRLAALGTVAALSVACSDQGPGLAKSSDSCLNFGVDSVNPLFLIGFGHQMALQIIKLLEERGCFTKQMRSLLLVHWLRDLARFEIEIQRPYLIQKYLFLGEQGLTSGDRALPSAGSQERSSQIQGDKCK